MNNSKNKNDQAGTIQEFKELIVVKKIPYLKNEGIGI